MMNPSHSVKLRPKTLARLRTIAREFETSVAALIKHAVEEAIDDAWRNKSLAVPIRGQKSGKAPAPLDQNPQPVKLEPGTDARLRSVVEQIPLLKVSAIIRGAVERFVENAFREKQVLFKIRVDGSRARIPAGMKAPPPVSTLAAAPVRAALPRRSPVRAAGR